MKIWVRNGQVTVRNGGKRPGTIKRSTVFYSRIKKNRNLKIPSSSHLHPLFSGFGKLIPRLHPHTLPQPNIQFLWMKQMIEKLTKLKEIISDYYVMSVFII